MVLYLKNSKKLIKTIPQNIIENPAKLLIYVGLTAYWVVIIFGTFFQI